MGDFHDYTPPSPTDVGDEELYRAFVDEITRNAPNVGVILRSDIGRFIMTEARRRFIAGDDNREIVEWVGRSLQQVLTIAKLWPSKAEIEATAARGRQAFDQMRRDV